MADKVDAPFGDIEIVRLYNDNGKGASKIYLVVSLEALEAILRCESAVIDPADIPRLLVALCGYARNAGHSDNALVEKLYEDYSQQVEDDE